LTQVGDLEAIVPSISGQAWITDMTLMGIDPTDPFPVGYTLPDTWAPVDTPPRVCKSSHTGHPTA
jgi:proline racemase